MHVGAVLPTTAQCFWVLRLQELLHVLLEGDIHCGHRDSSGSCRDSGMETDSPLCALTFAVGVRVGRAEPHQALPEGSKQLLAGAEGPKSLQAKSSPTLQPLLTSLPPNPAFPALTELSVTPRRMTGREKANLAESSATGRGPQRAPRAETPPRAVGLPLSPRYISPPPTPEPPVPLQEESGAHGAVGSQHRAPLLLRHIARLPATEARSVPAPVAAAAAAAAAYRPPLPAACIACEPGPGPGQGQQYRQHPPRCRHGSGPGTAAPGMRRAAPRYSVRRGTCLKGATP